MLILEDIKSFAREITNQRMKGGEIQCQTNSTINCIDKCKLFYFVCRRVVISYIVRIFTCSSKLCGDWRDDKSSPRSQLPPQNIQWYNNRESGVWNKNNNDDVVFLGINKNWSYFILIFFCQIMHLVMEIFIPLEIGKAYA